MPKAKRTYVCSECGYESLKWTMVVGGLMILGSIIFAELGVRKEE